MKAPEGALLIAAILATGSCRGPVSEDGLERALPEVSECAVYFGHQSVGRNILEGLEDIRREAGSTGPRIVAIRSADDISGPGVYHAEIGENTDPEGKIRAFAAALLGGVGSRVDIALMKLCYVDIDERTDAAALFSTYRETVARLSDEFPDLALVHVTAPLVARERGVRALAKRIAGKASGVDRANLAREVYNGLLRAEYEGRAAVFDLARLEASRGRAAARTPYALLPDYTDDGGHLNRLGRRKAAEGLVITLAEAWVSSRDR